MKTLLGFLLISLLPFTGLGALAAHQTDSSKAGSTPGSSAQAASRPTASPSQDAANLMFRRQWEPRQHAFSVLVPNGWLLDGGMFSIDPTQAGGAGNSVDTKCDLTVKRDAAGTVLARWLPSYNYADFSGSFEFSNLRMLFPAGRVYNGMQVRPLPTAEAFLTDLFRSLHPRAAAVRVVERIDLPELVEICDTLARGLNRQLAGIGKPPITFKAGAIVVEYTEEGTTYKEALATALSDLRASAALWNNQFSFMMRSPLSETVRWKPVLDVIRQSIQFNPEWVNRYIQASGERGATAAETMRYLARIDQEIFERHSKTRSATQHENYLLLSGQEEYVNPFTKEVERDASDYKYRWTTSGGDRFYTESETVDPNRQPGNQLEWKRTPIRPR
jgi:hypothetical protein